MPCPGATALFALVLLAVALRARYSQELKSRSYFLLQREVKLQHQSYELLLYNLVPKFTGVAKALCKQVLRNCEGKYIVRNAPIRDIISL